MYCHVGKSVYRIDFTVTKLLHEVDLLLGINWLLTWNPVIDWQKQIVNMWTGFEWDQVTGNLLNSRHEIGIVKDSVHCGVSESEDKVPDFTVVKVPRFWEYKTRNHN